MILDFGVLVTQIIAFVIFAWILKLFAWGPILAFIDQRRETIEKSLKHAEEVNQKADALHAQYEAKMREVEADARERINAAVDEGRRSAEEIRQQARQEAREIIEQGKRNVELELLKAKTQLEEVAVDLVVVATERLLKEKLNDEAHRRLIGEFIAEAAARN